jgi:hypothetical protein
MTVLGGLVLASSAQAATLAVDDNGADCPAAPYTSIQAAVDAAAPGDTVAICAGNYIEGTGAVGTNALTITKDLTIKGAGADLVSISPRATSPAGGQIMEATPDLRNGIGDVVAVVGAPTKPVDVDISGVTVDGWDPGDKPIVVEAGIVYLDARGSIVRSRVTNTVTSEADAAYNQPGGYRNATQPGVGIVQTSRTLAPPVDGTRTLRIELTRVDKYNRIGVLIDGATNDTPPLVASGAINRGEIVAGQIVGRTQCINYQGTGNCSTVGPVTTGPLFGQDGLRVTAGARAEVTGSLISQNLVNGTGAPVRGSATNNANLTLGAGIRLLGAKMTTGAVSAGLPITNNTKVDHSNITDNAYGALNLTATGADNTGASNIFLAENNWWGLAIRATTNLGPALAPTTNPPFPENPVNGAVATDGSGGSTAVDFFPFRGGVQSDSDAGEYAIAQAPLPVDDEAPKGVSLVASTASPAPGQTVTLTAGATDDFGIQRMRIYDGASAVSDMSKPPYTTTVTIPASAACGSTRTFSSLATDSSEQTAASPGALVTVTCPAAPGGGTTPVPTPSVAPSIAFSAPYSKLAAGRGITLSVKAPAGVKSVQLLLAGRVVCRFTAAPYTCKVTPTGADVGLQALTASVTDNTGAASVVSRKVRVPKFSARLRVSITTILRSGGKARRTIHGKLLLPKTVTTAQGCKSGTVTLTIKRSGHSFYNQQVALSKACTFSRSVTAPRSKQQFSLSARFGGNGVLGTTTTSRRFS